MQQGTLKSTHGSACLAAASHASPHASTQTHRHTNTDTVDATTFAHTCSLSLVSCRDAVTRAQSPPGDTGLGANAHGVRSLLLPTADTPPEAPSVMRPTLAVTSPPSLLLLKFGSCVMKLRVGQDRVQYNRRSSTLAGQKLFLLLS